MRRLIQEQPRAQSQYPLKGPEPRYFPVPWKSGCASLSNPRGTRCAPAVGATPCDARCHGGKNRVHFSSQIGLGDGFLSDHTTRTHRGEMPAIFCFFAKFSDLPFPQITLKPKPSYGLAIAIRTICAVFWRISAYRFPI